MLTVSGAHKREIDQTQLINFFLNVPMLDVLLRIEVYVYAIASRI